LFAGISVTEYGFYTNISIIMNRTFLALLLSFSSIHSITLRVKHKFLLYRLNILPIRLRWHAMTLSSFMPVLL